MTATSQRICPKDPSSCPTNESLCETAVQVLSGVNESGKLEDLVDCYECRRRIFNLINQTGAEPIVQTTGIDTISKLAGNSTYDETHRFAFDVDSGQPDHLIQRTIIDRDFELIERIGAGGMGVVYRARQRSLDRECAIKCIRSGADARPEEIQRFRNEFRALGKLDHPGIVKVFGCGHSQGQYYFAMQYVAGKSLAEHHIPQPHRFENVVRILSSIVDAIAHAHELGVIHRDLKPANIIVDERNEEPRVVDFGLARMLEEAAQLTATRAVIGTPVYMAPEQANGESRAISRLTDIFGLGGILYFLLTGRPPSQSRTPGETIQEISNREIVPPSQLNPFVDDDLEAICLKCLEKNPGERYASALDLQADLKDYRLGKTIRANPRNFVGRLQKWYSANSIAMRVTAGAYQLVSALAFISWALFGLIAVNFVDSPEGVDSERLTLEIILVVFMFYLPIFILGFLTMKGWVWPSRVSLAVWLFAFVFTSSLLLPESMLEGIPLLNFSNLKGMSQYHRMMFVSLLCLVGFCGLAAHAIPFSADLMELRRQKKFRELRK